MLYNIVLIWIMNEERKKKIMDCIDCLESMRVDLYTHRDDVCGFDSIYSMLFEALEKLDNIIAIYEH